MEVLTSFCRYYGDWIARVCSILSAWRNSECVDFIGCKTPEQVSVIGVASGFKKSTDVVGELLEPHQIVTDRLRQWKVWPIYQRWRWGYTGYCYIPGGDSFRLEYKINDNNILILKYMNRNNMKWRIIWTADNDMKWKWSSQLNKSQWHALRIPWYCRPVLYAERVIHGCFTIMIELLYWKQLNPCRLE